MTWYFESIPPVPETTAAMVKAAFPKGNLYVDLHRVCCTNRLEEAVVP
jgi:hypothetical protein